MLARGEGAEVRSVPNEWRVRGCRAGGVDFEQDDVVIARSMLGVDAADIDDGERGAELARQHRDGRAAAGEVGDAEPLHHGGRRRRGERPRNSRLARPPTIGATMP